MLSLKKQLFLLFSSIHVLSFAQLDSVKTDLNEIPVNAIRIKVLYRSVAQNVVIISKEQIQNSPARSLQEVLSMVAGLDVRQRGVGGVQADIGIRGGSFEQTLFLLNGVKLTDPQTGHHAMNIPIPLDAIERIEVVKGPSMLLLVLLTLLQNLARKQVLYRRCMAQISIRLAEVYMLIFQ